MVFRVCILSFYFIISSCVTSKPFQIKCVDVSNDAYYIFDVTNEGNKKMPNFETVKFNALKGILYNGISGSGCITQKPLIDAEIKAKDPQNPFLRSLNGNARGYNRYIIDVKFVSSDTISNNKMPITQSKYRVTINKQLLVSDLIAAGLLKKLSHNF